MVQILSNSFKKSLALPAFKLSSLKRSVLLVFSLALLSPVSAFSLVPEDSEFRIQARVTDSYQWSKKHQKYNLKKINMNFSLSVSSENQNLSRLVHQDGGENQFDKFERFISVFPDAVRFEVSPAFKPDNQSIIDSPLFHQDSKNTSLKEVTVKASLSEDQENLTVHFHENKKKGVLLGMLHIYGLTLPLHSVKEEIVSSDYQCRVQKNNQFVCTIDYSLKTNLQELLNNLDENEPLYQQLSKAFSS